MSETETYSDRREEAVTIIAVGDHSLQWSNQFWLGKTIFPEEHRHLIEVGNEFVVETIGFSRVTGIQYAGEWLVHESDQDLERAREERAEERQAQYEREWEENHESWAAREAGLSEPLRQRIERFREKGGHAFETNGWAYELCASELADLYVISGLENDEAISAYAEKHGTTGNQHDFAKAIAAQLIEADHSASTLDAERCRQVVVGAPSALTPLTGDSDYSRAGEL